MAETACRVSRVEVGEVAEAGVGTPDAAAGVEDTESGYIVSIESNLWGGGKVDIPLKAFILRVVIKVAL